MWKALIGVLALAAVAAAAGLQTVTEGTLQSCFSSCTDGCAEDGKTATATSCAVGWPPFAGTSWIKPDGAVTALFEFTALTNTPTIKVQVSLDKGVNWFDVAGCAQAASNTAFACAVQFPAGMYRINVTTCPANCTFLNKYKITRLTTQ